MNATLAPLSLEAIDRWPCQLSREELAYETTGMAPQQKALHLWRRGYRPVFVRDLCDFVFPSLTRVGREYVIEVRNNRPHCQCEGFCRYGRCWHVEVYHLADRFYWAPEPPRSVEEYCDRWAKRQAA